MKTLKLLNGGEIPVVGLGTFKGQPGELEQAIRDAVEVGYRHFDCAWVYGNEKEIGIVLQEILAEGKAKREELFITSKLWNNFHDKKNVLPKLKESLKDLKLDYLDLYLIHWPMGFKETADAIPKNGSEAYSDVDYLETWQALEECAKLGLAKNIGVSNFNIAQLQRVLENCTIKPSVNQVEVNPNINQKELREFCAKHGIVITGFCPLGRNSSGNSGYPVSTLTDPKVVEIAKKHNKTPAQVVLKYLVNLGVSVIPKSVTKARIAQNIDIFDFDLDDEDTKYLDSCNKNVRVSPSADYKDHKYYPFEK